MAELKLSADEQAIWDAMGSSSGEDVPNEPAKKPSRKRAGAKPRETSVDAATRKRVRLADNPAPRQRAVNGLKKWVEAQGGYVHPSLEFRLMPNTGGVFATSKISAGALLLRVPEHATIAPRYEFRPDRVLVPESLQSALAKQASRPHPLSNFERTCAHLIHARGVPDSPFRDYLSTLPQEYPTPMQWSNDDIACLRGTNIGGPVKRGAERRRSGGTLRSRLAGILSACAQDSKDDAKSDDFDIYRWATGAVTTRGYHHGANKGPFLIPLVDLINHHSTRFASRLSSCNGVFLHVAERDLSAGEELLTRYGEFGDSKLLHTYGFVEGSSGNNNDDVNTNPYDCVFLQLRTLAQAAIKVTREPSESTDALVSELVEQSCRLVGDGMQSGYGHRGFEVKKTCLLPAPLLQCAVALCLTREEAANVSAGDRTQAGETLAKLALDPDLRAMALTCLITAVGQRCASYADAPQSGSDVSQRAAVAFALAAREKSTLEILQEHLFGQLRSTVTAGA